MTAEGVRAADGGRPRARGGARGVQPGAGCLGHRSIPPAWKTARQDPLQPAGDWSEISLAAWGWSACPSLRGGPVCRWPHLWGHHSCRPSGSAGGGWGAGVALHVGAAPRVLWILGSFSDPGWTLRGPAFPFERVLCPWQVLSVASGQLRPGHLRASELLLSGASTPEPRPGGPAWLPLP